MATKTINFKSKGFAPYIHSSNNNEYQEHPVTDDNYVTIGSEYKIDSIKATFNDFLCMGGTNRPQDISLTLFIDSTEVCSKTISLKEKGSYADFTFETSSISSSTSDEIVTSTIDHIDLRNNSNYAIQQSDGGTGQVTITYSKKAIKPGKPTIKLSKTTAEPGEKVTLSWSAVTEKGTATSIKYYIYKNGQKLGETTSTKYTVTAGTSKGDSYVYTVRTYGVESNLLSDSSNSVTLLTSYDSIGKPKEVSLVVEGSETKYTSLYYGYYEAPNTQLTWTAPDKVNRNAVESYTVFHNGELYKSGITDLFLDLPSKKFNFSAGETHIFTVKAIPKYGAESSSDSVSINIISKPNAPTITSTFANNKVTSNPTFTWSIPSSVDNSKDVRYQYTWKLTSEEEYKKITTISSTSFTLGLDTNDIKVDSSFVFRVRTRITGTHGGASYSNYSTTPTITRISSLTFPTKETGLWTQCYGLKSDGTQIQTPDIYTYGYNYCKLTWNAVTSTAGNDKVKYSIYYKIGSSGTWTLIKSAITTTTTNLNLTGIPAGSKIYFSLQATDGISTASDDRTLEYNKYLPPIISSLTMASINRSTFQPKFTWNNADNGNATFTFSIYLIYKEKEYKYKTGTVKYNDNNKTWQEVIDINITANNTFAQTLLADVVGDIANNKLGVVQPKGKIKLVMQNEIFTSCKVEKEEEFIFNFIPTDFVGPSSFSIANGGKWVNPGVSFNYTFNSATWTDIEGSNINQKGGQVQYEVINNNNNTSKEYFTHGTYQDSFPTANDDITLTYTIRTYLKFQDYTLTATKTISDSIVVARWTKQDNISIKQVSKTKNEDTYTIAVTLAFPPYLNGSKIYPGENISQIKYRIYDSSNNPLINIQQLTLTNLDKTKENTVTVNFTTEKENLSIYAKATFYNTSEKSFTKTSTSYVIRGEGVPFAIRKGRIGINVDSTKFIIESSAEKNSALYITSLNDEAPILELSANNGNKFISFSQKGTLFAELTKGSNYLQFSQGVRSLGHMAIYGSINSSEQETSPVLNLIKYNSDDRILGSIMANHHNGHIYFRQRALTDVAEYEYYHLPTSSDAGGTFYILTTKSVITPAQGGTGQTSVKNASNAFINALPTGTGVPQDDDYYISQYVGGGNTTTDYYRRKFSTLYTYIKNKTDGIYASASELQNYLPLSGGTLTGTLTMKKDVTDDTNWSTGALNMNNSNIYGVNGIYFKDGSANAKEGIHFYKGTNTADTIYAKSGTLYFTPNRTLGSNGTDQVIMHTGNIGYGDTAPTSPFIGQIWLKPKK